MSTTYFVDVVDGLDSNVGSDMDAAFKTVSMAHTACVTGDVIFLLDTGTVIAENVVISKDRITLFGASPRVEINPASGNSVTVTGDDCTLKNFTAAGGSPYDIDINAGSSGARIDVVFSTFLDGASDTFFVGQIDEVSTRLGLNRSKPLTNKSDGGLAALGIDIQAATSGTDVIQTRQ